MQNNSATGTLKPVCVGEGGVAVEETDSGAGNTMMLLSPEAGCANARWDIGIRYDHYSGQSDPYGFYA
ncbi:MAG: hypothetical protein ACHQHN_11955 [Sphingobacteriales bacterium]